MKPIRVPDLSPQTTRRIGRTVPLHPQGAAQDSRPDGLARRRASLTAAEIAEIVRGSEETVRRWLKR